MLLARDPKFGSKVAICIKEEGGEKRPSADCGGGNGQMIPTEVDEGLYSSRSLGVSLSVFDEVQISSALSILPPPIFAAVLPCAPRSQPHPPR
jgi:hypothetical protein